MGEEILKSMSVFYPLQQGFYSPLIYTKILASGGILLTHFSVSQRRTRPHGVIAEDSAPSSSNKR